MPGRGPACSFPVDLVTVDVDAVVSMILGPWPGNSAVG